MALVPKLSSRTGATVQGSGLYAQLLDGRASGVLGPPLAHD